MVNGSFVNPPPFGAVGDYSEDISVNLGSYMNITWTGGPSGLATLWLFKDGNEFGTCTPFNLAHTFCTPVLLSFQNEQSYRWLVQTYDQNYTSAKPWYYFVIRGDSDAEGYDSHYFNIDPPLSTSTTSAISTAATTSQSTSTGTSLTTSTTSTTSSATSSPLPASQAASSPTLSTGAKAAIGVAIGVGIPLLILLIYIAIMLTRRRFNNNTSTASRSQTTSHPAPYTGYNADGTPSEPVEAPNDNGSSGHKPHGGYYQVSNPHASQGYKSGWGGQVSQTPMSELSGESLRR